MENKKMTRSRLLSRFLAFLLSYAAIILVPTLSHAQSYSITQLADAPGTYGLGFGINNLGDVAGAGGPNGSSQVRIWNSGSVQDLSLFGGVSNYAHGINDRGQVVGVWYSIGPQGGYQMSAAVWNGSNAINLSTTPSVPSAAFAINNSGLIAGFDGERAVTWNSNGEMTVLGSYGMANAINEAGHVAGNSNTGATLWSANGAVTLGPGSAMGMNDLDQVVGIANQMVPRGPGSPTGRVQRAMLWDGTSSIYLDNLSGYGVSAYAIDINNSGDVIGWGSNAQGESRALLWQDTHVIDLNTVTTGPLAMYAVLTEARAINESGVILVNGYDIRTHLSQVYLLAPVPLPAALWLLLSGLGGIAMLAKKRNDAISGDSLLSA